MVEKKGEWDCRRGGCCDFGNHMVGFLACPDRRQRRRGEEEQPFEAHFLRLHQQQKQQQQSAWQRIKGERERLREREREGVCACKRVCARELQRERERK